MLHETLLYSVIFLGIAICLVSFTKKIGVGSVLGYLIAGIIIGPSGFKYINEPGEILHFAELGVVILLFLIGLELNPKRLWKLKVPILGFGGSQVIISSVVFFFIFKAFGLSTISSIFISIAFAFSSTAIALQIMGERGMMKTELGQSTFSILLFQDLAVIPVLSVIPLFAETKTDSEHSLPFWVPIVVVIAIILGGKYVLKPIFRYLASLHLRELFLAASLFLVLGVACVMDQIGLSMGLGSFLAGVLLAESEFRHQFEADLEPFKGLLLGLFFISVGMSIDIKIFETRAVEIILGAVGVIILKIAILWFLGKVMKIPTIERILFTFLISQGGQFSFVILGKANQFGLIEKQFLDIVFSIIVITMAITPFLILLYDKTILNRFIKEADVREEDKNIKEQEKHVVIAGYGRFGQMIGRMLSSLSIPTTILDQDANQLAMLRKFGIKVFYGDAARIDLLEASGIHNAKALVVAIDDKEASIEIAEIMQQYFPHVPVFCRAIDRGHAYRLLSHKVKLIVRETFESSLSLAEALLRDLGYRAYQSRQLVDQFRKHDLKLLHEAAEFYEDEKKLIAFSAQSRKNLEDLMSIDENKLQHKLDETWDLPVSKTK